MPSTRPLLLLLVLSLLSTGCFTATLVKDPMGLVSEKELEVVERTVPLRGGVGESGRVGVVLRREPRGGAATYLATLLEPDEVRRWQSFLDNPAASAPFIGQGSTRTYSTQPPAIREVERWTGRNAEEMATANDGVLELPYVATNNDYDPLIIEPFTRQDYSDGDRSPFRYLLLPFALAADIVTLPFQIVAAIVIGSNIET